MNRSTVTALLLVVLFVLGAHRVSAETVTFSFSGTVTSVNPDTIGAIGGTDVVDVGDTIAGSFTYDVDTPGVVGGTGPGDIVIRTDYPSTVPPGRLTYSVGGLSVTTEPGTEFFVVLVGNSHPSNIGVGNVDLFYVAADSSAPIALESVFRLEDTTQSVFDDTELPTKKLKTKDFDQRQFEVFSLSGGFSGLMFVTSIDRIRRTH